MSTQTEATPPTELVPMLPFAVGIVRATAALATFVLEVRRSELPDPIALRPRVLRPV
jgi:hypothetical protein